VNRAWVEDVERLHQEGIIDGDDQNTLIRHLEEHRRSLQDELQLIVPEYKDRIARDGQQAADEWLAAKARELGERDGEKTRRVLGTLSAVQNQGS
jgi:hypothetical protein